MSFMLLVILAIMWNRKPVHHEKQNISEQWYKVWCGCLPTGHPCASSTIGELYQLRNCQPRPSTCIGDFSRPARFVLVWSSNSAAAARKDSERCPVPFDKSDITPLRIWSSPPRSWRECSRFNKWNASICSFASASCPEHQAVYSISPMPPWDVFAFNKVISWGATCW